MNTKFSKLFFAIAAGAVLTSGAALAESTYGYNAAGTTDVLATAKVKIVVAVPKLLILRVGQSGIGFDTLTFNATLATGIPGGIAAASLVEGDSQASGWSGAAPTFATPTAQNLTAYAWTNSSGGGQLKLTTVEDVAMAGITASSITVSGGTGGMAHPATTASANFAAAFPRNTANTATWAYSVDPAALAAAVPGASYEQTTTYTATSL